MMNPEMMRMAMEQMVRITAQHALASQLRVWTLTDELPSTATLAGIVKCMTEHLCLCSQRNMTPAQVRKW